MSSKITVQFFDHDVGAYKIELFHQKDKTEQYSSEDKIRVRKLISADSHCKLGFMPAALATKRVF